MTAISIRAAAASLAVLAATACMTTGVGTGQSASGSLNAAFNWTQTGGTSGTMTANLSNGSVYQGQFFEVTRETQVSNMGPLWAGWGGRWAWRGWGWWGPSDSTITHYSGQVLANLQGPAGYMRCHFTLASPSSGMDGGGSGECQLPTGTIINTQFPPSHSGG